MSEYGDIAYRLGDKKRDEWLTWRETVQEWKHEKEFRWSEVAYIALDPTMPDQFVAIRNDGTWSGAIDDANSAALTAFAYNFFRLTTPRSNSGSRSPPKAQTQADDHTNGASRPNDDVTDLAMQALYNQWSTSTALLFASALAVTSPTKRTPKKLEIRSQSSASSVPSSSTAVPRANLLTSFPYLPPALTNCVLPVCALQKADPNGLRACKHDVERLFKASGEYSFEWLRQERLRWHPDRFGRLCEAGWKEEGKKLSEEMFKIVDGLIGELESKQE
ncbi:Phosphatidylglycerol/phosphatidylinositol transfer protein [Kalmusia sp. IMI 367209]|nr:Phosphatidylglycerol/phosphatidylinositol transfer protein [Kalmusia sp. IMI 367209]